VISSWRGAAIVAAQTLRAHKLRTALTCLSLAIAVLAMVAVDAASETAAQAVVAEARLTQGLPETWRLQIQTQLLGETHASRALEIASTIVKPDGGSVALVAEASGSLDGTSVSLVAVKGDLRGIRPFRVISGEWLSGGPPNLCPEVVVGRGISAIPVGGVVRLSIPGHDGSIPARVVGAVDDASTKNHVYINIDDLLLWTDVDPGDWSMDLLAHTSEDRPAEAASALSQAAVLTGLGGQPSRLDSLGATADALAAVRMAFLLVAAVALLVGVLGILNIGLVSLRERVEEIGLRRATGATAVQIGISVLMEAILAALAAALIAVLLAWLSLPVVTSILFSQLAMASAIGFPYQTAVQGIAVAGLAGLAGGIIPAVRASRMNIADVMRA
jgi:putative ABC transport system permease protein